MNPPSKAKREGIHYYGPVPPKKTFLTRFFMVTVPLLNLSFAGYLLLRAGMKSDESSDSKVGTSDAAGPEESASGQAVVEGAENLKTVAMYKNLNHIGSQIFEDDQRKLFQWILEEQRKIKTTNQSEKKEIDENKAILKQFIAAKKSLNL